MSSSKSPQQPQHICVFKKRPETEFNHDFVSALTMTEIDHIVDIFAHEPPSGVVMWAVATIASLPWGILVGWIIWG